MADREIWQSLEGYFLARATKEDYDAVQKMSKDVLSGFDYILPLFSQYIEQEENGLRKNFVLLNEAKNVVGFQSFFLLENGQSVFVQGLRVHPELRGMGVGRIFLKMCHQELKKCFGKVINSKLRYHFTIHHLGLRA